MLTPRRREHCVPTGGNAVLIKPHKSFGNRANGPKLRCLMNSATNH